MINKLNLFKGGERKVDNDRTHSYKEKFLKECATSVIYLSVYVRFIRANDLNLNS